ncbi:MAG: hypothetical protein QOD77_1935 [Thermoplasmata archaeon]|jgi:hypothetical protein|nr:hypothetical protein [Thermoplasmata archaeon]
MTLRAALAVLVAAVLAPSVAAEAPPDAFCIVVIEPTDGFRQVRITVDEDLNETARQSSWADVDLNGDGRASQAEAEAFRYGTLKLWPGGLDMGNKSLFLAPGAPYTTATPIRPVYATTWRHLGHGFYDEPAQAHDGSTLGAEVPFADFETQAVREYGFHVAHDFSRMTLHGAQPNATAGLPTDSAVEVSKPVIESVVVRAPAGWVVQEVVGVGYNGTFTRTGDQPTMELQGFDTSSPWQIRFFNPEADKRLGHLDGPGLEAPAALAALAAAVAVTARARRRGA